MLLNYGTWISSGARFSQASVAPAKSQASYCTTRSSFRCCASHKLHEGLSGVRSVLGAKIFRGMYDTSDPIRHCISDNLPKASYMVVSLNKGTPI